MLVEIDGKRYVPFKPPHIDADNQPRKNKCFEWIMENMSDDGIITIEQSA